ncbi:CDP-alcohol phosphatidyltransferase family protein [Bacteroidota bacterium]
MKIEFKKINTIPNWVSVSRFLLIIPIFVLLDKIPEGYEYRIYSGILMLLAGFTDLLDGHLARKLNQISELGKIIDPLADKIAVALIVIKLFLIGVVPGYYILVILLRDLVILLGGIYVSSRIGKVLPSNLLGKITVLTICFYLLGLVLDVAQIPWLHDFLLYLSLIMSFVSVIGYGIRGRDALKWSKNEAV